MTSETADRQAGARAPDEPRGLSPAEVAARIAQYGLNELPEAMPHPVRDLLARFWGPVPWMLELGAILEPLLGRRAQAAAFTLLLVVSGVVAFAQQRRALGALAALRRRLTVLCRVLRDGWWVRIPARELVPGDTVHARMGDLVPADLRLRGGEILVDQSTVTGESAPVEAGPGAMAYAGTVVRRGDGWRWSTPPSTAMAIRD